MNPNDNLGEAIDLLQLLGLNEYEARCYVALTRMDTATARKLSEVAEVPRTRVYDAIRVLEAQELVEVQPSNPKQFRAVPIEEAIERIRNRYQARFVELQEALNTIDPVESPDDSPTQQVWSMIGRETIESRAIQLVKETSTGVALALGDESLLTEPFAEALTEAGENLELVIYAPTEAMRDRIRDTVPVAKTVLSRPEWLHGPAATGDQVALGRVLLIDQSVSLISSIDLDSDEERAVFSQGPKTPLVSLIDQFMIDNGVSTTPESKP